MASAGKRLRLRNEISVHDGAAAIVDAAMTAVGIPLTSGVWIGQTSWMRETFNAMTPRGEHATTRQMATYYRALADELDRYEVTE